MSKYEQIIDLLSDGEWHTKDDLGEVTVFPELWLDELRHEPAVEIVSNEAARQGKAARDLGTATSSRVVAAA